MLSIVVAACFLLIAGLANFSSSYAALEVAKTEESQIVLVSSPEIPSAIADDAGTSELHSAKKDDDCPCKHHNWGVNFLCGLSLATLDDPAALYVPSAVKTRFLPISSGKRLTSCSTSRCITNMARCTSTMRSPRSVTVAKLLTTRETI